VLRVRLYTPRVRDIDTIDSALRLVAALRSAARQRGGPMPSMDVADALLVTWTCVVDGHGGAAYPAETLRETETFGARPTVRTFYLACKMFI
jgi:hypothetical protein